MSKRCCAKNCFNSVLYNRNIAYFSFPKNKEFADRWAEAAGRNDLKEKSLSRLVKYYLCSEHFTANCFLDKDTKQTLKRNLPHSIALPTIFKNNLQETMQNANPRQSIEVHNIILLDVEDRTNDSYSLEAKATSSTDAVPDSCAKLEESPSEKDDYFACCRDLESQCLETYLHSGAGQNLVDTTSPPSPIIEVPQAVQIQCRLCARELKSDETIAEIKESIHVKKFLERVMKDQISVDDDLSQVVCKNCENNALLSFIIIQQMDEAQEKILPPRNT